MRHSLKFSGVLAAGALLIACNTATDEDVGAGGSSAGGQTSGGDDGSSVGRGGESSGGSAADGAEGGNAGTIAATGGQAGEQSGGSPQSGGASGGNNNAQGGSGGTVNNGLPTFCNDDNYRPWTTDGMHDRDEIRGSGQRVDPSRGEVIGRAGMRINRNFGPARAAYVTDGYDSAANGEVAVVYFWGFYAEWFEDWGVPPVLDNLVEMGEIPPVIALLWPAKVWDPTPTGATMAQEAASALAALRQEYPKISNDPAYHVLVSHTRGGAKVFDAAWSMPNRFGKVISSSGHFDCSQRETNDGYVNLVNAQQSRNIKVSLLAGRCDRFGTCQEFMDSGCPGDCGEDINVDTSGCNAGILDVNLSLKDALDAQGYQWQFLETPGGSTFQMWMLGFPDQLRWALKDITCSN